MAIINIQNLFNALILYRAEPAAIYLLPLPDILLYTRLWVIAMFGKSFIDSIKKNRIGICIILFASLLTATGQMFWKISGGADILLVQIGFLF